ncbi:cupin domain-containing protein [Marinomonas mediterranea]|jgi:Anti-sigma factor|uniref:Anti-ECFsigma factor, ChrR n=1 Tax=Marinomonas mediterranea (strain ATCC 700492 / JCM 21426 / NBRC 103028 / MMB-1) TaxID=717774 RepID=F2K1H3_MARM1|nr:cupin domain-containing protein [Marinomonas mediterranea]ADZ92203.1 anti-ECFsigma factor, ChrR [Marinomonas mediterranea MMB-1]WCN18264.1 anti-sigma factor [Marinomonas mediterranea MMB-1]
MFNMNFAESIIVDTANLEWQQSPMAGVDRKPLAREQAERGHATSIVRYAAGSVFRPHPHPLGEEILVLSGIFSDEMGEFPAGTYFRNPPGTSHAPHSASGCVLFVKLHQFLEHDLNQIEVSVEAIRHPNWRGVQHLYEFEGENVFVCSLNANEALPHVIKSSEPIELFIIEGQCEYDSVSMGKHSWLRTPYFNKGAFNITSPVIFWVKQGHFSVDFTSNL